MRDIAYEAGTGVESVPLNGAGVYVGDPNDLHGREWDYTLGYSSLSGQNRAPREVTVPMAAMDLTAADRLRAMADRDVANGTPGFIRVGEWRQRAYIVAASPSRILGGAASIELKAVLLDGVWRKGVTFAFTTEGSAGETDLDLPYDLPYDLAKVPGRTSVSVGSAVAVPVGFRIFGQVKNPTIEVAGNVYEVDCDVPSGARIEIDPIARTAKLIERDGTATNVFPKAKRGTGLGSGSYVFEPLPPGRHGVKWSGAFGFDMVVYEESGEPQWC